MQKIHQVQNSFFYRYICKESPGVCVHVTMTNKTNEATSAAAHRKRYWIADEEDDAPSVAMRFVDLAKAGLLRTSHPVNLC